MQTYAELTPRIARAISRLDDRLYHAWKYARFDRRDISARDARFSRYVWDKYGMSPATIGYHVAGHREHELCAHQRATYAGKPRT